MKSRKRFVTVFGAFLFLFFLTALPAFAGPEGACYITPTPGAFQSALANPFCLQINLVPGTYKEHGLTSSRDLVIRGSGADTTIIDGMQQDRILEFDNINATVIISDLTLRNGKTSDNGGGIWANGKLFVRSVNFENNSADYGGAVYGRGGVTSIQYSTFSGNIAAIYGGAVRIFVGVGTIDSCTFKGNSAGLEGGAIAAYDNVPLDVTNSTFKNNQTPGLVGSPFNPNGGAISTGGPTNIMYTKFKNNRTNGYGGALEVYYGHLTYVWYSTFTKNKAGIMGGAIDQAQTAGTLYVYFDTLKNNAAPLGGGIAAQDGENLLVGGSTFVGNKAAPVTLKLKQAASVSVEPESSNPPPPIVRAPEISGYAGGGVMAGIPAIILNSTFSGNTTTGSGGGIYADTAAALSFVTFGDNQAAAGGSIYAAQQNPYWVHLKNTILQGGTPYNCAGTGAYSFTSYGGNLSSDHSCEIWLTQTQDKNGANARLGLLANNGGKTQTRALLPGSPAIHRAIDCKDIFNNNVPQDQREFPRSAPCDKGAYQVQ